MRNMGTDMKIKVFVSMSLMLMLSVKVYKEKSGWLGREWKEYEVREASVRCVTFMKTQGSAT